VEIAAHDEDPGAESPLMVQRLFNGLTSLLKTQVGN